jgi:hypothetical protein
MAAHWRADPAPRERPALVFSALALDAHAALDLRANEQPLPVTRDPQAIALPIRVRLSLASSASGGELSAEIATVSVPGSTKR